MSEMIGIEEIMKELDISKQKGYKIIRQLNKELEEEGYITLPSKVPRSYWRKRFYCENKTNQ